MTLLIFLLLIASGWFLISCKWEYDRQESLAKLESKLRSGDWRGANHETGRLITIIIYRDCKGIPCVSPSLRKEFPVGQFLYKITTKRLQKSGVDISLGARDYFSTEEIERFPINKLKAMDNLWKKYSQGQFGFSVQASIYQQYGKTSNRSIRNDEFQLNDVAKMRVKPSQIKKWRNINFFDYMEKHEKDLLLKLGWMHTYINDIGLPVVCFSFSFNLDESSEVSSTYLTPVRGMFPCNLGSGGALSTPTSFLLWRKLLRGSVID